MSEPIGQQQLLDQLGSVLERNGKTYRKSLRVRARPAIAGELIESVTSDGKETEQRAKPGQFVVENQTEAKELYLMSQQTLQSKYELVPGTAAGDWWEYLPLGMVRAIKVDSDILDLLDVKASFEIEASWGSAQKVAEDDFLVQPLPEKDEIYRVAQSEFQQTYTECEDKS